MILRRIDPLLGKDLETDETTAVAVQRRGKHTFITLDLLLETCFLLDPCKGITLKTVGASQLVVSWELSSARESVKIGPKRMKMKSLHR
jgi:hypothetical protein